jgi:hypothetical protein
MPKQAVPHSKTSKKLSLQQVIESVKKNLQMLTGFPMSSVISISEGEPKNHWQVEVELIEKTGIPDRIDIMGHYAVTLNATGEVIRYERRGLRRRGDTYEPVSEE